MKLKSRFKPALSGQGLVKLFSESSSHKGYIPILRGVADVPLPILIEGATGSGKSTVGEVIKELSKSTEEVKTIHDGNVDFYLDSNKYPEMSISEIDNILLKESSKTIYVQHTFNKDFLSSVGEHIRIKCFRGNNGERYFHIII